MCERRGLKVNAGKSKVNVLGGEEGLECEDVSEFKYFESVLDESGTEAECRRKVASGRSVAGAIMTLVNARGLQLDCGRVLHQ